MPDAEPLPIGEDVEALPPELADDDKADILSLVRACQKEEQYSRRQEVRWARHQRYYERGDQNIGYDQRTYSFIPLADYAKENNQKLPKYTQVYNIYRPRLRSLVAVLSQVTPGVNFQPDSLKNSNDISAAQFGEKLRHKLYRDVDLKAIQTEVARMFCTDARAVIWTKDDGTIWQGGVLESKVPIHLKDTKQWGYCVLSWEEDINRCKDEFPDAGNKIQPSESSTTESNYERIARLGVLGGTRSLANTDDGNRHLTTRHEAFIDVSRYRKLKDETKKKVQALFPFGMRVTVCGGAFCDAVPDSMWEQRGQGGELIYPGSISVRYASAGDGANRPSLLKDMVPLQDSFNDTMNLRREAIDYGIPATWFDSQSVDEEAISSQAAQPGAMHGITVPNGASISNLVMQEQPAVVPPDAMAMTDMMIGAFGDSVSGDLPSLNGGQIPSSDTVGVYSMSREQALGGLSQAWAGVQGIIASMTYQGVIKMAQRLGDEEVAVDDESGTEAFTASEVLRGGFKCYPDQDSSFPETTASKRAALMQAMQTFGATEQGQKLMELPENARFALQVSGLEDIVIPEADADQRQLEEIEQLLSEPPVPQMGPDGKPVIGDDGQPTLHCSVPIDETYDLHEAHFAKVQNWMQSAAKTQQIRKGNNDGVLNVSLHGKLHQDVIAKRAADAAKNAAAAQQKPPTVSIAYKDVQDPNAQAQILGEVGVQSSPETIQEQQGQEDAKDMAPHILAHQKNAEKDFGGQSNEN